MVGTEADGAEGVALTARAPAVGPWFWVFLPAVLIAAMQVVTIPAVMRRLDIDALIAFQAMLSTWPWLSMTSLGLEKKARDLHASPAALAAWQPIWLAVIALSIVLGVVIGIAGGLLFGNRAAWLVFCLFSALSGAMSPAREIFFAQGRAAWIGRVHSTGLAISLAGLVVALVVPLSLPAITALWVVPQVLVWSYVCRRAGFRFVRPASAGTTLRALRESLPFALQGAGFVALSSFDLMILRTRLADEPLLNYIVATRTLALAFLFSGAAGNTLVRLTVGAKRHAWSALLATAFAIHLAFSLAAAVALFAFGDRLFGWLIPGVAFRFGAGELLVALAALAVARSFSEAALQMTGRSRTTRLATIVFLLSVVGLAQLAWIASPSVVDAVRRTALAWSLPGVYLLWLILAKRRR